MNGQPRILVVDDVIGSESDDALTVENRRVYCTALGLRDEVGTEVLFRDTDVAEAVFTSGQIRSGNGLVNNLDAVAASFRCGWPNAEGRYWSAVIVDMKFGNDERFGLKVIDLIHRIAAEVPIIVVSSMDQMRVRAAETLRDAAQRVGAQDFLSAPGADRNLDEVYRATPGNLKHRLDVLGLIPDPEQRIVGTSVALCRTLREIRNSIPNHGVGQMLLTGGPGVGKSYFEDYVNRTVAVRLNRHFERVVAQRIPLGGLAEDMQKIALFGTAGATQVAARAGAFELAGKGGAVFLDEIGELGSGGQSDLLGPLQPVRTGGQYRRSFNRVGSSVTQWSSCFVWAATHRDLDQLVRENRFSEALLQRFGKPVLVPALKDRKTDLPLLIESFVNEACDQYGIDRRPRVDVHISAWEFYAEDHSIRELRNHIQAIVSGNRFRTLLTEADFFRSPATPSSATPLPRSTSPEVGTVSELTSMLQAWSPDPRMPADEFLEAFEKLDFAFAKAKLRLWRELVARQKAIGGKSINLIGTVKQLLGAKPIQNSTSGRLAAQIFRDARIEERPDDPILAEIWDRRSGARNGKN